MQREALVKVFRREQSAHFFHTCWLNTQCWKVKAPPKTKNLQSSRGHLGACRNSTQHPVEERWKLCQQPPAVELLPLRETLHFQNVERVQTGVVGNCEKKTWTGRTCPRARPSHVRALTAVQNGDETMTVFSSRMIFNPSLYSHTHTCINNEGESE